MSVSWVDDRVSESAWTKAVTSVVHPWVLYRGDVKEEVGDRTLRTRHLLEVGCGDQVIKMIVGGVPVEEMVEGQ